MVILTVSELACASTLLELLYALPPIETNSRQNSVVLSVLRPNLLWRLRCRNIGVLGREA
jgi:hypothetical protein